MCGYEGCGIGLVQKLCVYVEQDVGKDIIEVNVVLGLFIDVCCYDVVVCMLCVFGVSCICLLINNLLKMVVLVEFGIEVVECEVLLICFGFENECYLCIKVDQMGYYDFGYLFEQCGIW